MELQPEDDAATVMWGDGWQTPSWAQWYELFVNTVTFYAGNEPKEEARQQIFMISSGFKWTSGEWGKDETYPYATTYLTLTSKINGKELYIPYTGIYKDDPKFVNSTTFFARCRDAKAFLLAIGNATSVYDRSTSDSNKWRGEIRPVRKK